MSQLGFTFDASQVEPQMPAMVYPAGDYVMQAIRGEIKPTQKNDGSYLELEFDILDGEYAGRKYWERMNLWSANPQAVEIAQRTMSSLCRATGQMVISDSDELLFKPVKVKLTVRPKKNSSEMQNGATYLPLEDGDAPSAPPPAAPTMQYATQGHPAAQRPPYGPPAAPPRAAMPPQAPAAMPPAAMPGAAGAPKPWERNRRPGA